MYTGSEIAIVGLSGRFPGANSVEEYWSNLSEGKESIRFYNRDELLSVGVEAELADDPDYVPANGAIDNIAMFDADFFGFSPRDAAIMDPQHRLFLECCWEALENSGYNPTKYDGSIGVFAGSGMTAYMMYHLVTNPKLMNSVGEFLLRHTGNDKDFLTTRASYNFNLTGPSINVQTACSTSAVAVHIASQNLLNGECDIALAGGVTIMLQQDRGYLYEEGEILSPDGHCRPFDKDSQGTIFGSGCGIVVLKRLEDAIADRDTIHAIIKGSAINNDGSMKVSYLAPSVDGQAQVIAEALAIADLEPTDISYIEAHGTGTPVGDPIEMTALKEVYGNSSDKHCAIGSVKSNIGHLDTAAGVAGLLKIVGALKEGAIPPTLHFKTPNPSLGIENSPFFVADKKQDWNGINGVKRAGLSSLGVGGTNAHIIVEEAPQKEAPKEAPKEAQSARSPFYLLPVSARTEPALDSATSNLVDYFRQNPELDPADVAYTLSIGRDEYAHRKIVAFSNATDAADALAATTRGRVFAGVTGSAPANVVFMFAGGGAQYFQMGADLYRSEPVYRSAFDECAQLLSANHSMSLTEVVFPSKITEGETLDKPSTALPALFATAYAVAQLLISKGISPTSMTGHSMGEYTAACLAGVMSLQDALALVVERGRLFETLRPGSMLNIDLPESSVKEFLPAELSIAAINAPGLTVVSGPTDSIQNLASELEAKDIDCRLIKINVAAHSSMVEPILDEFRTKIGQIKLNEPQLPFISNVTGTWITAEQATDPEYWVSHIRNTVRFADGIGVLLQDENNVFLEVGPGRTLSSLVRMHPDFENAGRSLSTLRHPLEDVDDNAFLLTSVGQLWLQGVEIDWHLLFKTDQPGRIPLPTYPFERKRHWIDAGKAVYEEVSAADAQDGLSRIPDIDDWFYEPHFVNTTVPNATTADGSWLLFSDGSSLSEKLADTIRERTGSVLLVHNQSGVDNDNEFFIDSIDESTFTDLFSKLAAADKLPERIVYMWRAEGADTSHAVQVAFSSLFCLEQTIADEDLTVDLTVVTSGVYDDSGNQRIESVMQSLSTGPVLVGPHEMDNLSTRLIDVAPARPQESASRIADIISSGNDARVWRIDRDDILIETIVKIDSEEKNADRSNVSSTAFKNGGTYLVTGGLGGIGSEIATFLASEYEARLVLIGRSDIPDRDTWADVAATTSSAAARVRKLIALESSGAEVLYVKADVRKAEDLASVKRTCEETFGRIDGIIHAAGILRDNLIQLKTVREAQRVLGPKVAGTLAIEQVFDLGKLDFLLLFSSTSSRIGLPGQIDYASANAFLNAFARYASSSYDMKCVALNWGMWSEVGMTASEQDSATRPTGVELPFDHPLFSNRYESEGVVTGFALNTNKLSDWFFVEHQIRDLGPVLPGTMYIELALAAAESIFGHRSINVQNVFFLAPCTLGKADSGRIFVSLDKISSGYRFAISSFADGRGSLHVSGILGEQESLPDFDRTVDDLLASCDTEVLQMGPSKKLKQEDVLVFGPRWKNIQAIHLGDHEAVATLSLPDEYRNDLDAYAYHPALLDMATGFSLMLIDGFEDSTGVYAPLSYKSISVNGRIPSDVVSYVKYTGNGSGSVVAPFDIVLFDNDGNVIAVIREFVMRRTEGHQLARVNNTCIDGGSGPVENEPELVIIGRQHGIRPDDGIQVVQKVLGPTSRPEVIASSIDYHRLVNFVDHMQDRLDSDSDFEGAEYSEPRDEIEKTLCNFWEDLLGIDRIGIDQDFFDAGGHSLIAVRLFTRIRKKFGVELSLASLFTAPTIRESAELLRSELGLPGIAEAEVGIPSNDTEMVSASTQKETPKLKAKTHNALVPIRKTGSLPAFFCVHGAGGNVINFWDISRHLDSEQPFYGLQMRGVDGKVSPPGSIEEMASEYIDAIRSHQPNGPYSIGGYSGGGVVAYEMARQLKQNGQEVALLVLFDTFCPTLPAREGKATSDKVAGHFDGLKAGGFQYLKVFATDRYRFERNRLRKRMIGFYHRIGLKLPIELRDIVLVDAYHRAQDKYVLKPYDGSATLFTAAVRGHAFDHVDDDLGWSAVEGFDVDIVKIPGDHATLMLEPNVNVLSSQLQKRLISVQQRRINLKSAV